MYLSLKDNSTKSGFTLKELSILRISSLAGHLSILSLRLNKSTVAIMVSQFIYDLCHEKETVSSRVANDPDDAPGTIADNLYSKKDLPKSSTTEPQGYDLQRAFECGNWGSSRPSDLFLKVCA